MADGSDYSFGQAYRFVYLLLRGPKAYLEAFREGGDLKIDLEEIREVWWAYRSDLPGSPGLTNDEAIIVCDHNVAVDEHLAALRNSQPGLRSVIGSPGTSDSRFG
jgi:hypothetical protein